MGSPITPDGKHAYVVNGSSNTVSVIDTASNTVVAHGPGGEFPRWGRRHPGWETRLCRDDQEFASTVSVIDTAANTVVATVTVGMDPCGVAVTPDGKHAYVVTNGSFASTVSVIARPPTRWWRTITVGFSPGGVGIVPPPPGVPFLAFNALLAIQFGGLPTRMPSDLGPTLP